jgi:hypothetical protein
LRGRGYSLKTTSILKEVESRPRSTSRSRSTTYLCAGDLRSPDPADQTRVLTSPPACDALGSPGSSPPWLWLPLPHLVLGQGNGANLAFAGGTEEPFSSVPPSCSFRTSFVLPPLPPSGAFLAMLVNPWLTFPAGRPRAAWEAQYTHRLLLWHL